MPTYRTSNYTEQGGARNVIGGSLDVVSGGEIDIEDGGAFKLGGTAVTSSAAEINKLDGASSNVTAANLTALTGGSNTALHKHTLANGASDVTASAAEVNELDGVENVLTYYERVSIADVNAGKTLIAAVAGRTLRVIDFTLRAIGGAVGTATSVDLNDTASSPVSICAVAIAALTQNALVKPDAANVTIGAAFLVGCTADKGIAIGKTGDTADTATHVDVCITYSIV